MFLCLLGALTNAYGEEKPTLGSRGEGILRTDHFPARPERAASAAAMKDQQPAALEYPPYPYEDTFLLHSYPSSSYKLYIDFDGYIDGEYVYTVWDPNGDGATFSEAERLLIQKIWYCTSEDFMPFTIDVTTEEPGGGFPGMRCVVDGSGMYDGGWAYMDAWPDSDNYCYSGTWDDRWYWIATAVSHEVGHTLNLDDHGQTDGTGYYMGHGEGWTAWGAIMGWDSDSLGQWDLGEFPIPNHPEDSTAIIVGSDNPGVDFRPDDHGDDIGTTSTITFPATLEFAAEGIIEQRTDVDYFAFTTSGGNVQFSINEDMIMGFTNLDVLAKIHDSGGAVLYESNPLWEIWASFDVTLPAGNYYLSIDGTGQDHPDGTPEEGYGYSDYGCLGYYSILAMGLSGPDTYPPSPDPMTFATAPYSTSATSIAMVATTSFDISGVEYYFTCTAGGGNNSGWLISTSYTDTGLTPDTMYTYTVRARDLSPAQNTTAASGEASATTASLVDLTAPTPDPMAFATAPYATGATSITMVATTATDPWGIEYYFTCTAGAGNDSTWQAGTTYEDTSLSPDTTYTYTVKARDLSTNFNETAASGEASATTDTENLVLPASGGVLESFTSEYGSGWVAADLTNGITDEDGWASKLNPAPFQEFVYSFLDGADAILDRAVIHGGTAEGGSYYSKDVEVHVSTDGTTYTEVASGTLDNSPNYSLLLDLEDTLATNVKLVITSGYRTDYWDLAEFEVFGKIIECSTCGDLDDSGGDVDMVDFGLFADCWGEDLSLNASCICANLVEDDDHIIDVSDLAVFAELFLDSSSNYPPNDCSLP